MRFLGVFSLAIVLITVSELPITVILLALLSILVSLLLKHKNLLFSSCIACFLAITSRQAYQRRYEAPTSQSQVLSTGEITDTIASGKYLFVNKNGEHLLYSKKTYTPGNQIWLVGRNSVIPLSPTPLTQITIEDLIYSGFNGQKWTKMKGYTNMIYETNSVLLATGSLEGFAKLRYLLRQRLENTYTKTQTAGLVMGMLIGDKSLFSKSEYQLFIDSGLVHLVAVSGGNIVMLVTFLMAALFFIPFYPRVVLVLCAVVGYGIICGMDSSVLRAVVMGALSLIALLLGRGVSLWRLLALVYIGMLIFNPYFLVYDVGFLLSFSAVLGIVFIDVFKFKTDKKLPKLLKPFLWIWTTYLKPSLGATLGIFPVIIFFMSQINIGGIVGNMFVLPLVPFIMIGGFIGGFIPGVLQKYYTPIIDLLVMRNYKVAAIIDNYGITIIADASRVKFLLFAISTASMLLVILTLTRSEIATTNKDAPKDGLDSNQPSSYDDLLNHITVQASKKH